MIPLDIKSVLLKHEALPSATVNVQGFVHLLGDLEKIALVFDGISVLDEFSNLSLLLTTKYWVKS